MSITLLYAGLLGLIFIALTVRVIKFRQSRHVGIGDGGHDDMARAIRVHGNFAEFVPLVLILMALIETGGGVGWALHAIGALLVVCRLAHAIGLTGSAGTSAGRAIGAGGTMLLLLVCSVWGVLIGVGIA